MSNLAKGTAPKGLSRKRTAPSAIAPESQKSQVVDAREVVTGSARTVNVGVDKLVQNFAENVDGVTTAAASEITQILNDAPLDVLRKVQAGLGEVERHHASFPGEVNSGFDAVFSAAFSFSAPDTQADQ